MLTSVGSMSQDNLDYWLGTASSDKEEAEVEWLGGNNHNWLELDDDDYPVSDSDGDEEIEIDVDVEYDIM